MKPILKRWGVFLVVAGLLLALVLPKFASSLAGNGASAQGSGRSRAAPVVRVLEMAPHTVRETLTINGDLLAADDLQVRSEISGRVMELNFEEGGEVEAGQLLVKIRDDGLQAERRSVVQDLELARLQERRQARLLESSSTSAETYDEARLRREKLEAEVALIDARLAETEIRAPFAGRIGFSSISVGAIVEPSLVIATLQAAGDLEVNFAVPERYLSALRIGLPVRVQIEGDGRVYRGEILALAPAVDERTRTIACRARLEHSGEALLPGGFARVDLELATFDNALMVPAVAVISEIDHALVYVLEEGKAVPRRVATGRRSGAQVQIVEGLSAGDRVIISGLQGLRPGVEVQVLDEAISRVEQP